jgi:hypothetical protein
MANDNFFFEDSHLTEDGIFLYVDALKLNAVDDIPVEIRLHVETCLSCKKQIITLFDATEEQDYTALRPHPFLDQKKIPRRFSYSTITRIAAAILVGSGLALFVYLNLIRDTDTTMTEDILPEEVVSPDQRPEESDRELEDLLPSPPPSDLYAANFEPSPLYEGLVAQPFRSYGLRIYEPATGTEVADTVRFRWDTSYRGDLTFRVFGNRENEIFRTTVSPTGYTLIQKLEPGLYYWRLETEQELLYVDKFVVPVR